MKQAKGMVSLSPALVIVPGRYGTGERFLGSPRGLLIPESVTGGYVYLRLRSVPASEKRKQVLGDAYTLGS